MIWQHTVTKTVYVVVSCDEKSSVRNFLQKFALEKLGKGKAAKESLLAQCNGRGITSFYFWRPTKKKNDKKSIFSFLFFFKA